MRRDRKLWIIAPLLCIWAVSANSDEGSSAKLISECGSPDLSQAALDSCLERVRVREETDPSSQLQALEASLEQRESGKPFGIQGTARAANAPRVVEVAPERSMAVGNDSANDSANDSDSGELAPRPTEGASAPSQSGTTLEDEPPVADPPDSPADEDRTMDDDTSAPPQS